MPKVSKAINPQVEQNQKKENKQRRTISNKNSPALTDLGGG
jgi:hypothetical protein